MTEKGYLKCVVGGSGKLFVAQDLARATLMKFAAILVMSKVRNIQSC